MPSASQLYASGRWLNATDLLPLNNRRTAIIQHCEPELIGAQGGADQKTMLMLTLMSRQGQPWPKKLPLNKGNVMQMVAGYGDDYLQWFQKPIEVWAENVMFQGKLVPGIKVQPASNGTAQAQAQPNAIPGSNGAPAQAPAPVQASPPSSATAVAGMPPNAGPTWTRPQQQQGTPIDDDEIPF